MKYISRSCVNIILNRYKAYTLLKLSLELKLKFIIIAEYFLQFFATFNENHCQVAMAHVTGNSIMAHYEPFSYANQPIIN